MQTRIIIDIDSACLLKKKLVIRFRYAIIKKLTRHVVMAHDDPH